MALCRQRVSVVLNEQAEIQNVIDGEQGGYTVQAWDWMFYAEQVRREKYALDEAQLKPYFALNTVLQEGVFLDRQPAIRHHLRRAF
ncbi:dipeptidyl carboxypeptidase II [Salmonella enterica subsp. enterica]|uniref:Dipeptidyl carboxypeptidase II n=1 Tax=Salmonella enterica I TaxID=59201 RepID=A0A3S4LYE6_SALET|nr:dipeptidyl carboxypeptidase II [Salmonella enterica subsp. enterica]